MKATVKCRMDAIQNPDVNRVLISIGSAGYVYEPEPHQDDWKDILLVKFDDITSDLYELSDYGEVSYKLMDFDDAVEIDNFIKKNIGEEFVIHCDAGISRSTAVASYMEKYYDYEIEWYSTGDTKDDLKNIHVFNLLGRINYHSAFGDIDV